MKKTDLAWAAGIVDGEAHLRVGYKTDGFVTLAICIRMVHKPTLDKFAFLFGGVVNPIRIIPKNHRQAWEWILGSQRGATCLQQLIPYMVTKKEEAVIYIKLAADTRGKQNVRLTLAVKRKREKWVKRKKALVWREWKNCM